MSLIKVFVYNPKTCETVNVFTHLTLNACNTNMWSPHSVLSFCAHRLHDFLQRNKRLENSDKQVLGYLLLFRLQWQLYSFIGQQSIKRISNMSL